MYGKIFESMFRGSLVGAGAPVFAVMSYVIACMREDGVVGAQVELNPKLLAFILGEKEGVIEGAIEYLCEPDGRSTSTEQDGRRLVKMGQFAYQVVNGAAYMKIRNEEERREYFRLKKQEQRQKKEMRLKRSKPQRGENGFCTMEKNGEDVSLEPGNKIPL